jgi:hypothetical protein
MTLENRPFGAKGPDGLGDTGYWVFVPSHRLRRDSNITTRLLASLSLFEGSPAIQSLVMAAVLLLSGTALQCITALMPWRSPRRLASASYTSRENCPAPVV